MYCHHFGFQRPPFRITPDPELFFPGGNRGAVLDALIYAISRGEGMVKVVGEVGSGKTMLCRMLEREIPSNCEVIYLANPNLAPDEILPAIAFELKLTVPLEASKPMLLHLLHDYLLAKHADNRRVVMFVEEAQCMPLATLEEIRLLSNLETAHDKLLQIVLFGQPELDGKLAQHEIRQLNERITYRFHLAPFNTREIRDYLNARAQASGYRGEELFSGSALRVLARHSRGLLRRINVLADKSLLAAYSSGATRVRGRHVALAARDSEFTGARAAKPVLWPWLAGTTAGLLIALLAWQMPVLRDYLAAQDFASPSSAQRASDLYGNAFVKEPIVYADLSDFSLALAAAEPIDAHGGSTGGSDPLLLALERLDRLMAPGAGGFVHPAGSDAHAR